MSLATRCTSCGTIFRVVQDQLKVSEGWVRCGRCEQTFNALEGLFDLEREAPPPRVSPRSPSIVQGMADFVASQHPGRLDTPGADAPAMPETVDVPGTVDVPLTAESDAIESRFLSPPSMDGRDDDDPNDFADARFPSELPLEESRFDGGSPVVARSEADDDAVSATPPVEPVPRRTPWLQRWQARRAARQAAAMSSLLEPTADGLALPPPAPAPTPGGTPGFLRQAEDAARWRRPRVQASLVVATLLLTGVLLVQIAVQFRDAFAAQWPQARPAFDALCEVMGCSIEPLRRLSAISVESSGLTQVEGADAYRLSVTLHNRGQVDIALPSVDLSLTDNSGTLVARRALAPDDFRVMPGGGPPRVALAPGGENQLQVLLTSRQARLSGYTIELFYP